MKKIKKLTMNFLSDPGHGWLKVPKFIIASLEKNEPGLINQISPYSYERTNSVYLEEDVDAPLVESKLKSLGVHLTVNLKSHTNKQSRIRGYNNYTPECIKTELIGS